MALDAQAILRASALTSAILLGLVAACSGRPDFEGAPAFFDHNDGALPCVARACSRDLRSVVGGCPHDVDTVYETCPDDKGCGGGSCVDPCESARLSKGSVGCSFWTLPPDTVAAVGACYVAMIANTWPTPATIRAELGTEPLDISKSVYLARKNGEATTYEQLSGPLPAGEVGLVFLSQGSPSDEYFVSCPEGVVPAFKRDPIGHGTLKTRAFHLVADVPVSAYAIFPYGGGSTGVPASTLLLPESSWDTSYIAISPPPVVRFGVTSESLRTLQIVAGQDDTTVEMRPTVRIAGGTDVAPARQGHTQSWSLSRGQVLQFSQRETITGSAISTSKPVGLFGGCPGEDVPAGIPYADVLHQQIPPFSQWGTEYALVPFPSRVRSIDQEIPEIVPWSLVGGADDTVLTYDPERPRDAPKTLAMGEAATFFTDTFVVVNSQDASHPFYAALYMTGAAFGGGAGVPSPPPHGAPPLTRGDPEFVNVVPTEQFLDRYIFFADHTYPDTMLTMVRKRTTRGFMPVALSCGGEIAGWKPVGTKGEYEAALLRPTVNFLPQPFASGSCGYGRHEAVSEGPFSVTVWGVANEASYGYAGGTGSRAANQAAPPPVR